MIKCDLCTNLIVKYEMDINRVDYTLIKDKVVCTKCSKDIAKQIIEEWWK